MKVTALKKHHVKNNEFNKRKLFEKKENENNLLHLFSEKGWILEVKKIIGNVNLDARDCYDRTALDIAKEKKHIEIIEVIENQIELNNNFFKAIKNENIDKMNRLIELGANVNLRNENSYMPVHLSIFWKNTKALQKLIDIGADLNSKDEKGWTPLMIAANYGKVDHVNLLLKNYVDIKIKDKYGWDALDLVENRILNIGLEIQKELNLIEKILKRNDA